MARREHACSRSLLHRLHHDALVRACVGAAFGSLRRRKAVLIAWLEHLLDQPLPLGLLLDDLDVERRHSGALASRLHELLKRLAARQRVSLTLLIRLVAARVALVQDKLRRALLCGLLLCTVSGSQAIDELLALAHGLRRAELVAIVGGPAHEVRDAAAGLRSGPADWHLIPVQLR